MLSPWRIQMDPSACLATLPVSRTISRSPTCARSWMAFIWHLHDVSRRASRPPVPPCELPPPGPRCLSFSPGNRSPVERYPSRKRKRRRRCVGPLAGGPVDLLLAESELLDHDLVAVRVDLPEVVEETAPLPDQLEQAAAAVVILLVRLEVLGEVGDPLGDEGHLDLGRPGVLVVPAVLLDDFRLLLCDERHIGCSLVRAVPVSGAKALRHKDRGRRVRRGSFSGSGWRSQRFAGLAPGTSGGCTKTRTGRIPSPPAAAGATIATRPPSASRARHSAPGASRRRVLPWASARTSSWVTWSTGKAPRASAGETSRASTAPRSEAASRSTSSRGRAERIEKGPEAVLRSAARWAGTPSEA